MTQNIGHHGHDDQPDERLHDDHLDPDVERHREIAEWIDAITRRPWFVDLKCLPGEAGYWVGSEEDLIEELRKRTAEAQAGDVDVASEDFPSSASEIIEPPDDVQLAMLQERLWIMDYHEQEKEIREDFDAPGWGRNAPILLQRDLSARKPYHEAAAYLMTTKYRNPLAALIVEFTYHDPKFTRNNRQWWGRTRDLAKRLSIQLFWEFGMRELEPREKQLFDELNEALKLESPEDFRRFCGRMCTCAYILRDVGVKVSWEKHVGQKVATDEKYTFTWWTIEAPRWKKTQPY